MTLFILDGSGYQPNADMTAIKRQGFSAIIAKSTEGATGRDSDYRHKYASARDANLPFAAYHYVSARPPADQADNCAGMVNDKSVPIFLDLERTYHASLSMAVNVGHALNQRGYDVPVLYLPHFYWSDDLNRPHHPDQFLLWQALYPNNRRGYASTVYNNVPDSYWNPQGGEIPTLLQFSDLIKVDGYSTNTWDCSAYDGTEAELRAEGIFKYWTSAPKPPPNAHPFPLKPGQYFGEGGIIHYTPFKQWQQRMKDRGWPITDIDGIYGPEAKNVAIAFQHEKHLHVDGLIGRVTWDAAWSSPIT